jgi:hypothetical protein
MASPMVESRIEPHKKAHFTLHLSDRIRNSEDDAVEYSSVKCWFSARHAHGLRLADSQPRQPQAYADVRQSFYYAVAIVNKHLQPSH